MVVKTYCSGEKGKKVEDLEAEAKALEACGMVVPDSWVILDGAFYELVEQTGGGVGTIESLSCPASLSSVLNEILDQMTPGVPYFIRSSARSERGGTGIFVSEVFVPSRTDTNKFLMVQRLWRCIRSVYASEFSPAAVAWRERTGGEAGMAILIQKAQGDWIADEKPLFCPELSGTAYTTLNGQPTVRVVMGLGTKAVNGSGCVYHKPERCVDNLWMALAFSGPYVGIAPTAEIEELPESFDIPKEAFEAYRRLFVKLQELKRYGDFYLEWAISKGQMIVVQCARHEDKVVEQIDVDTTKLELSIRGNDVLHSGRAECNTIVFVRTWDDNIAGLLAILDKHLHGHLLIVPSKSLACNAISSYGAQLEFHHFSNAAAVLSHREGLANTREMHAAKGEAPLAPTTKGKSGATHFAQLCQRGSILFVGAEFSDEAITQLAKGFWFCGCPDVLVFSVHAVVSVDATKSEGLVYVAKTPQPTECSPSQIGDESHSTHAVGI